MIELSSGLLHFPAFFSRAEQETLVADLRDVVTAAPLFTPKHIDFVSKRLGNFQFNAQFYWMVTQSWVQ